MPDPIAEQARTFADTLQRIVRLAVNPEATFTVVEVDGAYVIGPEPFLESDHSRVKMRRSDGKHPSLELRVSYRCTADDEEGIYLQVTRSTLGLWVRPNTGSARPIFRIEYFREARAKPQAYVHIHAESSDLGWVYGRAGRPLGRVPDLHYPLGGRRFRPTLEDFLLFIARERLYTDWVDPTWRREAERTRDDFERLQARATVRTYRDEAATELRRLGYQVTPPTPVAPPDGA